MNRAILLVLAGLAATGFALDRSGTISEARVWVRSFEQLGDLAGELDICTVEPGQGGAWLVVNADAAQLAQLRGLGLEVEVTWPDIRDQFRAQTGVDPDDLDGGRDFGFFLTYWEMLDSLTALRDSYPELCSLFSIGRSYQNRELWCLKISDNPWVEEDEPACFFNGATHAREPIGPSCVVEFACRLLSGYGTDQLATWLVDNREIYIVPVMNPDGYVYNSDSGGASSNWRKNRQPYGGSVGVDLNRNYGYKWGYDDIGSSPNPASELYRGPEPFSEPAVAAARDFEADHRFRTMLDFHSYGRLNMYPWAYDYDIPPEVDLLREMADTFRVVNNYRTGQWRNVLYASNGTSIDWELSDTAGKFVSYAFSCELSTGFWTGWNDSAHIRSECGLNIPSLFYLTRVAGVHFDPVAMMVNDTVHGDSSGGLDPGETAGIWFTIRNRAVHVLDSAYGISAKLVSLDTLVRVLDSVKPFPDVHRRSDVDNRAEQFEVRAADSALVGDTIPLLLEVSFFDAGNSFTMPLSFEIVIGRDTTGIEEKPEGERMKAESRMPTVVQGLLVLGARSEFGEPNPVMSRAALLDVSGRKVMELRSGENDVRHLAPGVYYIIQGSRGQVSGRPSVKVIISD
ncbi:MAG: zinc carboxypeptidase [candidate division WOR-3 bacterium]|nr:MAG: zinc carboxypeptidase [candidate division WOR-3 bacterium]